MAPKFPRKPPLMKDYKNIWPISNRTKERTILCIISTTKKQNLVIDELKIHLHFSQHVAVIGMVVLCLICAILM